MIILDTNVVSGIIAPRGPAVVDRWVADVGFDRLWATSPVVGELFYGILRLPRGRRRSVLLDGVTDFLGVDLGGRMLAFGPEEAYAFADLKAARSRAGQPVGDLDVMIAATAVVRGATVATRNVRHFEGFGVDVVNPWEAS